ncbi:MAG: preprotein translocase subunit Sec61beta [Candidatus Bathyarchaeia archaeon]
MSIKKKRKKSESSPMPAASAGLLRFFEEETEGVKVRPEILIAAAIALIVICILARVFFR